MSLHAKFTQHPAAVGETYSQHLRAAMGFSFALLKAAFFCAVHAVFPFLFEKAGSTYISELHERMVLHRGHEQPEMPAAPIVDAAARRS